MVRSSKPCTEVIELENKVKDLACTLFILCEKRLKTKPAKPGKEDLALISSSMTLKKAIEAFLSVTYW